MWLLSLISAAQLIGICCFQTVVCFVGGGFGFGLSCVLRWFEVGFGSCVLVFGGCGRLGFALALCVVC